VTPFWPAGEPVTVQAEAEKPRSFVWRGGRQRITGISACWRVHTGWWRDEEIWRDYWEVITDAGVWCVLFHDLRSGGWFIERIWG
jgi:hypothetical protein